MGTSKTAMLGCVLCSHQPTPFRSNKLLRNDHEDPVPAHLDEVLSQQRMSVFILFVKLS